MRVARLRDICKSTGIRVVGPSSLGIVDLRTRAMLTANAAFDEPDLPSGRFFAASHSGSMIGSLLSRGKARGLGFAGLVSVGNEVDLSLGEICEATLDDPGIDGYMLFLETMRNTEALRRFALAASKRGKPILAYKLGRSEAARELAVSHTGALAGEDDVADAFLADCGIARVTTLDGLIEGLPLLMRVPVSASRRANVGVVTTTGGGATMVVDPLSTAGVAVTQPSAETLARFKAAGIDVKPARIVDVTLAGARYDIMKAALDILTTAPEYDHHRAGDRLLRALPSRACGEADRRQRQREKADRRLPGAGCARCAGDARRSRRPELPHAGGLRRRGCRGAAAAGAPPCS